MCNSRHLFLKLSKDTPPTTNTNQNNTPPIGMPPQDLAPPPPISTFGDTIVASNPFDDTPPNGKLHEISQKSEFVPSTILLFVFGQCIKTVWWITCLHIRIMQCEMIPVNICSHHIIQMLIRCRHHHSEIWWTHPWNLDIKWIINSLLTFRWCIQVNMMKFINIIEPIS